MDTLIKTGYCTFTLSDEEMARFYENGLKFPNLYENEYVLIANSSHEICDKFVYRNGELEHINWKPIDNKNVGLIKPKNIEQEMALDMLQDKTSQVKVLSGTFGSGKDFLMINEALQRLDAGDFDKLIWVRNNIEVKGVKELGALPGDVYDKVVNFAMPLADHLGGIDMLESYIAHGRIEVAHLGYMRGRDIKHSLIYVSEAENLTTKLCQVLISRLSEGSQLWMNGDWRQADRSIFETDSGLIKMIDRLSGNPLFGHVYLPHSVRSEAASLADLLDD